MAACFEQVFFFNWMQYKAFSSTFLAMLIFEVWRYSFERFSNFNKQFELCNQQC